jgi:hypothetical protein
VLAGAALLASACTDFPSIAAGECGNGVIEAQEDCDSFGLGAGTVCRAPGTVGECHLDCSVRDGVQVECPAGWGCGTDAICHKPTGDFDAPSESADVGAWTLVAGDFDGDGRGDVMSLEPLDSIGATRLRFYYFDQEAALQETREFPKLLVSPVVGEVSGDTSSDVVFSSAGIGVLLGRQDRSLVPETFSSFLVPNADSRAVAVSASRIGGIPPLLTLVSLAAGSGFYVPDSQTGKLASHASFAGTVGNLAGEPVSGNLFEDAASSPCLEAVFAERGSSHFTVVDPCTVGSSGAPAWRDQFAQQDIELEPRASIDAGALIADLNGDGHLDVLVGAGGVPYVSYGDGASLAEATPYRVPFPLTSGAAADTTMPLAAADVSGDGVPDFVFPDHLLVSSKSSADFTSYDASQVNRLSAPWTSAKIADLNGNGKLDIVTATSGALDVQFFNGSGGAYLTANIISTDAPVASLAVADFDGDFTTDLALLQMPRPGEAESSLLVAFGTPFALPAEPVAVAQLAGPEQLTSYEGDGIGNLAASGKQIISGVSTGTVTILNGSGDRIPFAPYTLSDFASTGSVQSVNAIGLAAGKFRLKDQPDVLAVAITKVGQAELWLAPAIENPGSTAEHLAELDPAFNPAVVGSVDFSADIASSHADLDRDGLDEAVFAMPAGTARDRCGILIAGTVASASSSPVIAAHDPVLLDEPCPDPQLTAVDVDGDQYPDLALLTGSDALANRQLVVLWNDKNGGFSAGNAAVVVSAGESPRSFAVLPALAAAMPPRRLSFAYVTKNAARLIEVSSTPREFEGPRTLASLAGGTGIVAADVNGDGVVDIVLAASGKLSVLKAHLEEVVP